MCRIRQDKRFLGTGFELVERYRFSLTPRTKSANMENWKRNLLFLGYVVVSTAAMVVKFYTLYDTSPNSFVLGVRFAKGDALLILTNMMIMLALIGGKLFQRIVFGELRLIEIEHLYERLWPTIIGLVVSANAYKAKENSFFRISLFVGLLFSKVFHCIVIDRLDTLIQQYYQPNGNSVTRLLFNRVVFTSLVFLRLDISILRSCIDESYLHQSTMLLGIAFELFLLIMDLAYAAIKFALNVFELYYIRRFPDEEVWSYKVWIDSIAKVILGVVRCIMVPALFTCFTLMDSIPLNLLNEIFRSFYGLSKSIGSLYRLIKNSMKLNNSLGYPTAEELQDDDICIICRDDLVFGGTGTARSVPRKLPCGHILHDGCIRSWLEMSNACPTCRKDVIQTGPTSSGAANNENGNENDNGNNLAAAAAAVVPPQNLVEGLNNVILNGDSNDINDDNDDGNGNNAEENGDAAGVERLSHSESNETTNDNSNYDQNMNDNITGSSQRGNVGNEEIEDERIDEKNGNDEYTFSGTTNMALPTPTPTQRSRQLLGIYPRYIPLFGRSDYFEVCSSEDKEPESTRRLHSDRVNHIGNVVDRIGSLNMDEQQRGRWKRVHDNFELARSGGSQGSELNAGDDNNNEFVHEVPPHTVIPKDWTIFPIEKTGAEEYEVELSRKRRVTMKVVRNGRIIDRNTFDKYTRK